jgi:PKD repeat protein
MALTFRSTLIVAAALLVTGCTTKKTEAPDLSGPSELATSISLTASPDILNQDGQSTSAITILARDSNGQPLRGLSLRADIEVNNVVTDFGQLSAKNVATGADGRASVVYKAPASVDSADHGTMVTIAVTPLSGDAHADFARTVQIRLVPTGTVSGGLTQVPDFQFSPTTPSVLESVTFDASDPSLDGKLVGYLWDFGDGSTGSGRTASHQYRSAGVFSVTLTVTDTGGNKGSRSKSLTVGAGSLPTAAFVFSPANPGIGETIIFDASQSVATAPRHIVSYEWQFGTGRSATGMVVSKSYDTPGDYNITLTVTDDAGNAAVASQTVTIGSSSPGGLTAAFTFSPTSPLPGAPVHFNASTSTSANPIASYKWDFGDGSPVTTTASATTSHTYSAVGTFVVTLTVKDSAQLTASTSQQVAVGAGATASFTMAPSPSTAGATVTFDASTSVASTGGVITNYLWNFGDSATIVSTTSPTQPHVYSTANTYVVSLTVTDSNGSTATTSQTQVVNP